MELGIHPDAITSRIGIAETGYGWHPTLRWLLIIPSKKELYASIWCPCGTVELLRHPYQLDVYIGVKYYLFPQLFSNDGVPLDPPRPLVLQDYAEKFYEQVGRSQMEHNEAAAARVTEMHAQARTFVEEIYQTVPLATWREIRATICKDLSPR